MRRRFLVGLFLVVGGLLGVVGWGADGVPAVVRDGGGNEKVLGEWAGRFNFIYVEMPVLPEGFGEKSVPGSGDEAVKALGKAVLPLGKRIVEVKVEGGPRVLEFVEAEEGKKGVVLHVGNDVAKIAVSEEVIIQVIPLDRINAVQFAKDGRRVLSKEAVVAADARTNALIVRDTSAKIHRLVEIIGPIGMAAMIQNKMDKIQLKHAKAVEVAKIINNEKSAEPRSVMTRPAQLNAASPKAEKVEMVKVMVARIYADSDTRTNTVVVTGSPEGVAEMMGLAREMDEEAGKAGIGLGK